MTDPKFVAFSTQKGGAGKTTLTVLVASYLYYVKGLKVLVVDCDYPQFSIEDMRQRDMDLVQPVVQESVRRNNPQHQTSAVPIAYDRSGRCHAQGARDNRGRQHIRHRVL